MITGSTRLAGLIGHPGRYSLSPQIHNAAYGAMGLDIAYLVMPVVPDDLGVVINGLKKTDTIGLSVTVPHKESVIDYLDHISDSAKNLGAVNCVTFEDGRAAGTNTDGDGFIASLIESGFDPTGKTCVVVGSGGAARAVVEALGRHGAGRIHLIARNADKASEVIALAPKVATISDAECMNEADLYVNTTPIGMTGHPKQDQLPPGASKIQPSTVVADLVYSPLQTPLLVHARQLGCQTVVGTGMLLHQAVKQIELWTQVSPPLDVMRQALQKALKS